MVSRVFNRESWDLMVSNGFLEQKSAEKSALNEDRAAGQVKHLLCALGISLGGNPL